MARQSFGGCVFGIAHTVVNPPDGRGVRAALDGLLAFFAGLAQVRVQIDEARARRSVREQSTDERTGRRGERLADARDASVVTMTSSSSSMS